LQSYRASAADKTTVALQPDIARQNPFEQSFIKIVMFHVTITPYQSNDPSDAFGDGAAYNQAILGCLWFLLHTFSIGPITILPSLLVQ